MKIKTLWLFRSFQARTWRFIIIPSIWRRNAFDVLWFLASLVGMLACISLYLGQTLIQLCLGKQPVQNGKSMFERQLVQREDLRPENGYSVEFGSWPSWLMAGEERVLPWHILLATTTVGCFVAPAIAFWIIKWTLASICGGEIALIILLLVCNWFRDMGKPLSFDSEYDDYLC